MELKPIPGFRGYFASEAGEIWSNLGCGSGTVDKYIKKTSRIQNSGYKYVGLCIGRKGNRRKKFFSVHRLVALAWHGEPSRPGMECRHLNCCKLDNRPKNLRWGSTKANFKDSWKSGHGGLKLNPLRVAEIRALIIQMVPYSAIARIYAVNYHTIYYIAEGMTWRTAAAGLNPEFRKWQRENLMRRQSERKTAERLKKKAYAVAG